MSDSANKQPFISVVVPIYNEEKYLTQCISALLQQNYPKELYEIILIDDGSYDKSPLICREFVTKYTQEAPKITYVRIRHSGLSVGRNTGIYLSQGTLIAFIDGDAVADKNWLAEIQKPFIDKEVGVVGGRINILNDESAVARFVDIVRHTQLFGPKYYKNAIIGTNMAYRKIVFDRVGGFYVEFTHRGDESSLLRFVLQHYNFAVAPSAIVYHERPDTLFGWLKTEYKEGYLTPLVGKVPSNISGVKRNIALLEKLLVVFSPMWLFFMLQITIFWRVVGLIGGILSIAVIIRRHFFKQDYRKVRNRLKQEYQFPFIGIMYIFIDWIHTIVKTTGTLVGMWKYRHTRCLSPTLPNDERIEQITTN